MSDRDGGKDGSGEGDGDPIAHSLGCWDGSPPPDPPPVAGAGSRRKEGVGALHAGRGLWRRVSGSPS